MRIHLMRQGLKTSISVDDHLILYLGNRLAKKRRERLPSGEPIFDRACAKDDQKAVHKKCRLWIQHLVDAAGDMLPASGISQWVQARIVDAIADPTLKDAEMQAMDDERWAAYEADEAKRKNSLETRAFYESLARKEMEKTPKHKWPRIGHFKSK